MKHYLYLLFALSLIGVLWASSPEQSSSRHRETPLSAWRGDTLTPAESTTVSRALDSIGTPPPDSIFFEDYDFNQRRWSCKDIAYWLRQQLNDGRITADTTKTGAGDYGRTKGDGRTTSKGDQMQINRNKLADYANPAKLKYLEELLVHEYVHKLQGKIASRPRREYEAYDAELRYKEAINIPVPDPEYQLANKNQLIMSRQLQNGSSKNARYQIPHYAGEHTFYIAHDSSGFADEDTLISFETGVLGTTEYLMGTSRISDMIVFQEPGPTLPPGHQLGILCGGDLIIPAGRITGLDIFEGMVLGSFNIDFGLPLDIPRFFYSMTYSDNSGSDVLYVLDTLNQEILTMIDFDGDRVPDEINTVFASAFWPGFEGLEGMLGIDVDEHLTEGFGIAVDYWDCHPYDMIQPLDTVVFLPDADGDFIADALVGAYRSHLTEVMPVVAPVPWPGDIELTVFGTWNHSIEVWATDSLGEPLPIPELLGLTVPSDSMVSTCLLSRPLAEGDYLMAIDVMNGLHLLRSVEVIDPAPDDLTIDFDSNDGMLKVYTTKKSENCHYELWTSDDSENFYNTGLISEGGSFEFPLPPQEMQFYQIRAVRDL